MVSGSMGATFSFTHLADLTPPASVSVTTANV